MTEYTLGFLFTPDHNHVLLLHRNAHEFHGFMHNGVGGKLIFGETPFEGMIREAKEETGLDIPQKDWRYIGIMRAGTEWKVWIFASTIHSPPQQFPEITEGSLAFHPTHTLPTTVVPNLHWIIPLCKDMLEGKQIESISVWYKGDPADVTVEGLEPPTLAM